MPTQHPALSLAEFPAEYVAAGQGDERPALPPAFSEAMRSVCQNIARGTDLARTLTLAVEALVRHLPCTQAALFLAESDSRQLTLCAVAGAAQLPAAAYHLSDRQGTPGLATATGENQLVDDFGENPVTPPTLGPAGMRTELSVPIWNACRTIGALTVADAQPGAFGPQTASILAWVAAEVAVALRVAEVSRQEAERALHSKLLTEISLSVNSTLELEQVLQKAVAQIGAGLKADRCLLGHISAETGTLTTRYEYLNPMLSERRSLKGERALKDSAPALLDLLADGQLLVSTDDNVHPALAAMWPELSSRYAARSLIWVPIPAAVPAAGGTYCLRLFQVTLRRHWSQAERELLRGIAAQLAMALSNAHLFTTQLQLARQLQEKNAELEALIYTVSHDVQAPVVSMRGFATLLETRHSQQMDERGRRYVSRIVANAEYLSQLLNDLLELSRINRTDSALETVPVGRVIDLVLADWSDEITRRGVALTLAPSWPEVAYSPTRLRQVFGNLLSNALKFLGPQPAPQIALGWRAVGEAPAVWPGTTGSAGYIEFSVRDNGIGIHPNYQKRIFGTFERLQQIDVAGTGIGLSIVKRIVESRGGTVRVESQPDAGATFYFTVPALAAPAAEGTLP